MKQAIYVLNGPNINLLGEREPEIYGHTTLAEIKELCEKRAEERGFAIDFRQTNLEGVMIDSIHEARKLAAGIIINPAGWSFTSIAILDALKMYAGPKIEFHISNIHQREAIYHNSLVSKTATAVMAGLGAHGYGIAIDAMAMLINSRARS